MEKKESSSLSTSNVHFTPLDEREKSSKLELLLRQDGSLQIWVKGSSSGGNFFKFLSYQEQLNQLLLTFSDPDLSVSKLLDRPVLMNFHLNGVEYFSTGFLIGEQQGKSYKFEFSKRLYRCERRKNFRLFTLFSHDAKAIFPLNEDSARSVGHNILEFNANSRKSGMTTLFKNFLSLVKEHNEVGLQQGSLTVRILDLSVTGVAFLVGRQEKELFKEGNIFSNFKIIFNGTEYVIPKGKVVYFKKIEDKSILKVNTGEFKVAIHYGDDVPPQLDQQLSAHINREIQSKGMSIQNDFEKFI